MGIEYSLRFESPDAEAVAAELRHLPGAREVAPHSFELREGVAEGDWPHATVVVEPGGAYFCDNCGNTGRAWLGHVIAKLTAFGAVTVEEL
jgi:hypothetical protein